MKVAGHLTFSDDRAILLAWDPRGPTARAELARVIWFLLRAFCWR